MPSSKYRNFRDYGESFLVLLMFLSIVAISASHVTMSVVKLLSRIVAPNRMEWKTMTTEEKVASELHDHTCGITSDALTQFSVVLSALIHDGKKLLVLLAFTKRFPKRVLKPMLTLCNFSVYFSVDHTGVPNTQLVQEATAMIASKSDCL